MTQDPKYEVPGGVTDTGIQLVDTLRSSAEDRSDQEDAFCTAYGYRPLGLIEELGLIPSSIAVQITPEMISSALEARRVYITEKLREENIDPTEIKTCDQQPVMSQYLAAAAIIESQRRHPERISEHAQKCYEVISEFYLDIVKEEIASRISQMSAGGGITAFIPIANILSASWSDYNDGTAVVTTVLLDEALPSCFPGFNESFVELQRSAEDSYLANTEALFGQMGRIQRVANSVLERFLGERSAQDRSQKKRKRRSRSPKDQRKLPIVERTIAFEKNMCVLFGGEASQKVYAALENHFPRIQAHFAVSGLTQDEIDLITQGHYPFSKLNDIFSSSDAPRRRQLLATAELLAVSGIAGRRHLCEGAPLIEDSAVTLATGIWKHYDIVDRALSVHPEYNHARVGNLAMEHISLGIEGGLVGEKSLYYRLNTLFPATKQNTGSEVITRSEEHIEEIRRGFWDSLVHNREQLLQRSADGKLHIDEMMMLSRNLLYAMYPQGIMNETSAERLEKEWRARYLLRFLNRSATKALSYSGNSFTFDPEGDPPRNLHLEPLGLRSITIWHNRIRTFTTEDGAKAVAYTFPYIARLELLTELGGHYYTILLDQECDIYLWDGDNDTAVPLTIGRHLRNRLRETLLEHILAARYTASTTDLGADQSDSIELSLVEAHPPEVQVASDTEKYTPFYFESLSVGFRRPLYHAGSQAFENFCEAQARKGFAIPRQFFQKAASFLESLIDNGFPVAERHCQRAVAKQGTRGEIIAIDSLIFRLMLTEGAFGFQHYLRAQKELPEIPDLAHVQLFLRDLNKLTLKTPIEETYHQVA